MPRSRNTPPPDLATPEGRARWIWEASGKTQEQFAEMLNAEAVKIGQRADWYANRVTAFCNGKSDIKIEQALLFARFDPEGRDWTWVLYGIAFPKGAPGKDAFDVLAQHHAREKRRGKA